MSEHQPFLDRLVRGLVDRGVIRSPAVEAAFRHVPRHCFLPGLPLDEVYRDRHITTKESDGLKLSSSTAPWLMAGMLEQLEARPGQRILEIGAGTGYNAAILARLVGEEGFVSTVDVDPDVVAGAVGNLARLGHGPGTSPAGAARIVARCADGFLGDPEGAPWDGILVTVRTAAIPQAWTEPLVPGGRLVVPLALRGARHGQLSMAFEKHDDHVRSESFINCGFVRPRGLMAMAGRDFELGDRPGLAWSDCGQADTTPDDISALLQGPRHIASTGIAMDQRALTEDFQTWLVAHDPRTCSLKVTGSRLDWPEIPSMIDSERIRGTGGLFDGNGIALLGYQNTGTGHRELHICSYGTPTCAEELQAHLVRWHRADRPRRGDMQIRLYAPGQAPDTETEVLIREPWGDVCIHWPLQSPGGDRG